MSGNSKATGKLTLVSLILMIFTSVYGFNNIPRSFYKMGYGAIPWYIISAIAFFLPFALMMAEYGAAFKNEKGGIYSWMEKSVGPKYAFIGTFMWYASYIIWMVNVASGVWVPVSNAIFGKDTTKTWALLGLSGPKLLGVLGILWILFVTFVSTKGLDKIKKITSAGGTAVAALNIVLFVGALIVLLLNGKMAQPIEGIQSFMTSPNPKFVSTMVSQLAFVVFAIFAFGGIEVVGGLVDQTENAEKTFPKGVVISSIIIAVGYALGIFMVGTFTNWADLYTREGVHIGNAGYVTMGHLGYQLGAAFGLTEAAAVTIGLWMARFVGLSMFLALSGAFFTLTYAPLKQIIEGTPAKLWPGKMGVIKDGMPFNAMWIQATIVCVMIALVSFGGESMSKFFDILVSMTNVAMTLPYMFLSAAFIGFKKKTEIVKPFEVYKSSGMTTFATVAVTLTVGVANFFTIIEPAMNGDMKTTIWSVAGPVIFTLIALLMYSRYEKSGEAKKAA